MGDRSLLIAGEVTSGYEAVANIAQRQIGGDIGEASGFGDADFPFGLGLGGEGGAEACAVGFGAFENPVEGYDLLRV